MVIQMNQLKRSNFAFILGVLVIFMFMLQVIPISATNMTIPNESTTKTINIDKFKLHRSDSPICREWTEDFKLIIELSRKGIGFRKR